MYVCIYIYIYIFFFALFSRESSLIPRFQLYNDLHIFIIINDRGKKMIQRIRVKRFNDFTF